MKQSITAFTGREEEGEGDKGTQETNRVFIAKPSVTMRNFNSTKRSS